MPSGIELTTDQARRETAECGEHLVCTDHRKAIAERDDNLRFDAGQVAWQYQVVRHRGEGSTVRAVVPMHPEQVARISRVGINRG